MLNLLKSCKVPWKQWFPIPINWYSKRTPPANYLNLALDKYSYDKERIFNIRGKVFKTLNLDIYVLSREEIIQLLLSDGKLIKRPFLIYEGKKVILGFNEIEYAKQLI